ncbi:MAG: hypothetical protein ABL921_22530 [Pirellula sp.]
MERCKERFWVCETMGIPYERPLFLVLGQLGRGDGELLVRSAHQLRWLVREFCIAIPAESESRLELECLIRRLSLQEHIHIVDRVEPQNDWIGGANAILHLAPSESSPTALARAKQLGIPVITREGNTTVKTSDESPKTISNPRIAWIYRGSSPESFADLMNSTIQNTPERYAIIREAKIHADSASDLFDSRHSDATAIHTKYVGKAG